MKKYEIKLEALGKSRLNFESIYRILIDNDSTACEFMEDGQIVKWTYSDYKEKIIKASSRLSKICVNISKDSYVALKMPNSPLWPVMFWSILMSGYKPLLLDAALDDDLTAYLMDQAGAKKLLTFPFEFEHEDPGEFNPHWSDEYALCTSGTTSFSKIYYYTGEAVAYQILNTERFILGNKRIGSKDAKILAFLPFHHIFGFMATYIWFSFFGATLVYARDKSPETMLEACRKHGVTHILTVPVLVNHLARSLQKKLNRKSRANQKVVDLMMRSSLFLQRISPVWGLRAARKMFKTILANLMGHQIRVIICGGSYTSNQALRILNAIGYYTICGFGMTEAGITSCEIGMDLNKRLSGSVGKPFAYVEYKIDEQKGAGGLYIKGVSIHSGRLVRGANLPADTDRNGWLNTGDFARYSNGSYWIEGRSKEIIVNESGENIFPDDLEDCFASLPIQTQLCVLGTKKDDIYEYITLVIRIPKTDMTEENCSQLRNDINAINNTLPIIKRIDKVYLTAEFLPAVNGNKVKRNRLKELIDNKEIDFVELKLTGSFSNSIYGFENVIRSVIRDDEITGSEFQKIKSEVRRAFSEVLELHEEEISDYAHFIDDLGGDSLSSISLLAQVEAKYNIIIPDSEYYGCTNVISLSKLISRKLKGLEAYEENTSNFSAVSPITSFEDSREYQAFMAKQKEARDFGNPYFICHDSIVKDVSMWNGVSEILNFGSYNYVGMSGHPETVRAAQEAAAKYGTSASGSRILAGEKHLYQELEEKIAAWKNAEDAIVLVSGHATNVSFVGNFCNENDLILYDILSHNSITQGCQLSKSDAKSFPHNNFEALESTLKQVRSKYEKILVVVEGVYSMDGDIAPIPEFIKLKEKYGFFLMVDEAHATAVIGEHGGGVDDYFDLKPDDIDIKMGTLSKGLGTCGGYIAGKKSLIDYLKYNMPGFVFSVGINPSSAAASLRAIEILEKDHTIIKRLHENIKSFINEAHRRGFNTGLAGETAIVPVMVGNDKDAFILSGKMLEKGVFVPPAVYPAVPKGQARLRFCITSEHSKEQIIKALDILMKTAREN